MVVVCFDSREGGGGYRLEEESTDSPGCRLSSPVLLVVIRLHRDGGEVGDLCCIEKEESGGEVDGVLRR
ncbi:hypothetical protein Hanom_Chr02g00111451 [Helianthus anomalus]